MEKGMLVMTRGVKAATDETPSYVREILDALGRYNNEDWGDISDDDKQMNDSAVQNGDDRILAAYDTSKGKIYIITEYDRSATTILFADEY